MTMPYIANWRWSWQNGTRAFGTRADSRVMGISIQQGILARGEWIHLTAPLPQPADLILVFGGSEALLRAGWKDEIRRLHPTGRIAACSTAGEIIGVRVYDETVCFTAVR